jgi:hypothetical protein
MTLLDSWKAAGVFFFTVSSVEVLEQPRNSRKVTLIISVRDSTAHVLRKECTLSLPCSSFTRGLWKWKTHGHRRLFAISMVGSFDKFLKRFFSRSESE